MTPTLYASLTGPLLGLYYPLPFHNEDECRRALNSSRLKSLWCSIYTQAEVAEQIAEYGGTIMPSEFAAKLDYDHHEVTMHSERSCNYESKEAAGSREPTI